MKVNYSGISTYRKCGKLYQYIYIDKLPSPSQPSGDMAFGTGIHLGVEAYLEGEDGIGTFKTYWDIEKSRNNLYGRYKWESLKDQGERLLDKFHKRHLKRFEVHHLEQTLAREYQGISFYGTPDFIGLFDGKLTLVDFKTSGSRYDKDKAVTSEQMHLYAWLAEGVIEQLTYFVFVKGEEPSIQNAVTVKYDSDYALSIVNDLCHEANKIKQDRDKNSFTHNRSSCIIGSIKCPYWNTCYGDKK